MGRDSSGRVFLEEAVEEAAVMAVVATEKEIE
jgi:hypothetical protein